MHTPSAPDAERLPLSSYAIDADLDWADRERRHSVASYAWPTMPSRFAVALLRERAAQHEAADLLYPPPTFS